MRTFVLTCGHCGLMWAIEPGRTPRMSLPPRPGRATSSRRPGSRALGVAAAALGTVLAFAAWVISQAGAVQPASLWPSGHGVQVRDVAWVPAPGSGTLRPGMRGTAVRRLQQRLAQ